MRYHFQGHLTTRDTKRNIPHEFSVPANSARIDIDFRFAPSELYNIPNLLTLTLFDPERFRGARHRDGPEHRVHIDASMATPGYLPGPLPAGKWTAEIDTHMIMPGEPVRYSLYVDVGEAVDMPRKNPAVSSTVHFPSERGATPKRGPGWYRGDLHAHTNHSDAGDRTVAELVQAARDAGLDFVFLTDHNTTAGLAEMDAFSSDDLLTAGGIELTTFWGHAVLLGTRTWVDWRVRPGTGEMAHLASAAYSNDQVFIIAHPQASGDPGCTGCAWRYGDMMPGVARLVEIWNGPWKAEGNNEQGLSLWYDWLNEGLHLVGTAGTDTHGSRDYAARPGLDVVYSETLSEAAVLEALRAGHLYLSAGPQVTFHAQSENGVRAIVGDTITHAATFRVAWSGCPPGARLDLIANGRLLYRAAVPPQGEHAWSMTPEDADWVVVEIRDSGGEMLALTNPIFLQRTRL